MLLTPEYADWLMQCALHQAALAQAAGEVPIGAVVAVDGVILGEGFNQVETLHTPTAHAEVIAIERAGRALGSWRLPGAVLCVTVEPCTMCTGALLLARIPTVIYGVAEPKTGALGSLYDLAPDSLRVVSGVREAECVSLLQEFFRSLRGE